MKKLVCFLTAVLLFPASYAFIPPVSFPRTVLIEEFTGQNCSFCPKGHAAIESSIEGMEDKIIRISHYFYDIGGKFNIPENNILSNAFRVSTAPACMLDRTFIPEVSKEKSPVFNPITGVNAPLIKNAVEALSYISVSLEGSIYDPATGILSVTVSGETLKEFPNARLNVFLTEDGFIAYQNNGGNKYRHDHVMRAVISENIFGDPVVFNNNHFMHTYTYKIPDKIGKLEPNPYNMTVIAFIADYNNQNPNNCQVHNASSIKLKSIGAVDGITPTQAENFNLDIKNGIVSMKTEYDKIVIYSAEGKRIKEMSGQNHIALAPGLYIIEISHNNKMTTRKILVK